MALPSPGMFLFEKALPLTPEEWMRLRQWMFSTTYEDAALKGENKATSQLLSGSEDASQHAKKTSTKKDGNGKTSAAASAELLVEDTSQVDAASLKFRPWKAGIPLRTPSIPTEPCQKHAAAGCTVSDIDVSLASSTTAPKDVARSDKRICSPENRSEATCAVPRKEAAARAGRRKRMRKQPGVLPLVPEKYADQPRDFYVRPFPRKKTLKRSTTAAVNDCDALYKAVPPSFTPAAAARHEAVEAADCKSEIVEENAGLWRVSVRKGSACITKHFSLTDSSDHLPELMLHLKKNSPSKYLPRSTAAVSCTTHVPATSLKASVVAAATAESSQDAECRLDTAQRTLDTATVPHPCARTVHADPRSKLSKAYNPTVMKCFFDQGSTTGAGQRAEASAQLYCDWVCKHFDQVHHYLSTSRSYLQPDARSRERAASLALQLLLNLPQDTEQQRYLQWITSFLSASSPGATSPDSTDEELPTLQRKTLVDVTHPEAASASAPFTSTPPNLSRHTPQSVSRTAGPALHSSRARASPCSTTTSSTKASSCSEAARSDAPVTPDAAGSSAFRLPQKASNAAAVAAEILESLCLLDQTENNQDSAQTASHHASLASESDACGTSQSERRLAATSVDRVTAKTSKTSPQYSEETSPSQFSGDRAAAAIVAAAAQLQGANGQAAAATFGAAGTATEGESIKVRATRCDTTTATAATSQTTVSGTTATSRPVISAAVDVGIEAAVVHRLSAAKPTACGNTGATKEKPNGKPEDDTSKTALDGGISATPQERVKSIAAGAGEDATEGIPTSVGIGLASCLAADGTRSVAKSDVHSETAGTTVSVPMSRVLTAMAREMSSTDPCEIPQKSLAAHTDLESTASQNEVTIEQPCSMQPAQLRCSEVRSVEGFSDEVMDAARALLSSLSGEKEATTCMEPNISSILQVLQSALEESAPEAHQDTQQHPGYTQGPGEQGTKPLPIVQQSGKRNYRGEQHQKQEGRQHAQQQQEVLLQPQQMEHRSPKQQKEQQVEALDQLSKQQQHDEHERSLQPSVVSETFARPPQSCAVLGQRQALEEEPEQSAQLCGDNSICTLLYSLLHKRLLPASEASFYLEDALLQERSLSYNDTDCSSQNSRKASSCADESLVQAGNSFASQAHDAFFASGESSSQVTTQTVGGAYESAALSGAFPSFLEENVCLRASELSSFSSTVTSSTTAYTSSSLGDVCWPPCDSSSHLKQTRSSQQEVVIPPKRNFELSADDAVHRRGRTAIFGNHAAAAAAVG